MANLENLTIMFTDIVGFSDLGSKLSREENETFLNKHDRILSKVIKQFGGKIIKTIGDSFLVSFRSPTDAVICGMAMQDALWAANKADDTKHPIVIRVALNAGEVRQTKNDIFGDAVNIAARLESITPANCIYLTEAVYLSMSKSEVCLEHIDAFEFKGVNDKVNVYQATHKDPEHKTEKHIETDEIDYPYGGAHIHHKASHRTIADIVNIAVNAVRKVPVKAFITLGIIALLTVIATAWLVNQNHDLDETAAQIEATQPDPIKENPEQASPGEQQTPVDAKQQNFETVLKERTEPLIIEGNYIELEKLLSKARERIQEEGSKIKDIESAYLELLSGHTHMYFQRYKSAVSSYEKAFELDKNLSSNPLSVENLMILLERERKQANQLIANNLNSLLITKLGERTGRAGLTGRYDAFNILRDSDHEEAIDRVGLNILDLQELKECKLKKVAVLELKRLKDPRSLDALKAVVKKGFFGQFKNSCLRKDAKAAIALIEAEEEAQ